MAKGKYNKVKDRVEKVDDRVKILIKKYPLVFSAVLLGGGVIGFALGWLLM